MGRLSLALLLASLAATAAAQNYPNHPVRIVIPLSPGGTTDVPGRMVAQKLSETLGQQFFVENKAGAGGTIGSDFVAKSKPDGYTLLLTASPFVISPHVYKNMPYNALGKQQYPALLALTVSARAGSCLRRCRARSATPDRRSTSVSSRSTWRVLRRSWARSTSSRRSSTCARPA